MFLWHCTSATLLTGIFYFVWGFFVRRSEIVFYVLVKETDRKINLSVEKRREVVGKGIFPCICFMSFAYLFFLPCFETIVACLKASV